MLFNSVSYAVFLPVIFALYWLIPKKYKWLVLLTGSYYYYMSWGIKYSVWIVLTTIVSYFCAIKIERCEFGTKQRKLFLVLPIVFIAGTLVIFKYFNFFGQSIVNILKSFSLKCDEFTLNLIMPVGISFYSFQCIGYLADVYSSKTSAQRHLGKFALFVSFFPQVLSGPIARANDLIPQLECEKRFDYKQASYGMRQIAFGFFKKLVVSNVCAGIVDGVYNSLNEKSGFVLVAATVLYAFQIYCDFSGYSDIAIGSAKILGINLMTNFKTPYLSQSIKEFWSRWHISLSTWLRDYIYIPLGGNRRGNFRYACNIIITFLISGMWHGAAATFIMWGLIHGLLQVSETFIYRLKVLERFIPKKNEKKVFCLSSIIQIIITFCLVCFTWIFFRANNISNAVYVVSNMFSGIISPISYVKNGIAALNLSNEVIVRLAPAILTLVVTDIIFLKHDLFEVIGRIKPIYRWIIYIVILLMIIVLAPSDSNANFIYFQF